MPLSETFGFCNSHDNRVGPRVVVGLEFLAGEGATDYDVGNLRMELQRHAIDLTKEPDSREVIVMCALELLADVAYHDLSAYDLAIVNEAGRHAGYPHGAIVDYVSHQSEPAHAINLVLRGSYRKNKKKLDTLARGMLQSIEMLADAGAITASKLSETKRQRWLARGGHDYKGGRDGK